jgi:hypothetical protein
MSVEELKEL